MPFFEAILWDPNRYFFTLPYLNYPLTWYGLLFACGFFAAYFVVKYLFTNTLLDQNAPFSEAKKQALHLTDRLTLFIVFGTLIGARLGHVFFYDWPYYKNHLWEIFYLWQGGLASHGAALGIIGALVCFFLYSKKEFPFLSLLMILDAIVIPAAFVGGCIRIGNFINQEVLGKATNLPWGVVFLHPIEPTPLVPLHPVQIYEALFYFATFALLFWVWKKKRNLGQGLIAGLFFLLVFGFRFFIEWLKLPQSQLIDESKGINMGQILSIPFVLLGIFLITQAYLKKDNE